jgi:methionine aminotransferase
VLSTKLPDIGTSIFTVMSKLAADVGAINLGQGFPDFDCDAALIDTVARHMREGKNQYAPSFGLMALREAIAAKYNEIYGSNYHAESDVTVTSGGTEALFDAIASTVHSGDEVMVFEPCYDSYVPAIRLAGGVPVVVSLTWPDYAIPWDDVRARMSARTRLIMINTPHNPAGCVLDMNDIAQLQQIVRSSSALILSDEVYEHIIFDGLRHESMARYRDLAARSFVVGSFGKTYHATGWKVGYCVAPAALTAEFRKVHQFVTFATNTPLQHALAEFLVEKRGYPELPAFYQAKRDRFLDLIKGSRFRPLPCSGSYFVLLDYSAITDEEDMAFAQRLTREHGVASIPTSAFLYERKAPPVLRFCFAKKDETLTAAAERLNGV